MNKKKKIIKKPITKFNISTLHLVQMMNEQDQKIAVNIGQKNKEIAKTIDLCVEALSNKGKVICVGTVTNGGLGILDVTNMHPIYERKNWINSIINEGNKFLRNIKDPKANNKTIAIKHLKQMRISSKDVVIGISSSGTTPYTIAAMKYAKQIKAKTIIITTTPNSLITKNANIVIDPILGVEIILNSTKMKSWSAYKFIINMISTGVMIKMGKSVRKESFTTKANNMQLSKHSVNIIANITLLTQNKSQLLFDKSGHNIQIAITMHYLKINKKKSQELLNHYNNSIKSLLEDKNDKLTKLQKRIAKKAIQKLSINNGILKINYVRVLTGTKKALSKTTKVVALRGKKLQHTTEMNMKKLQTKLEKSLKNNKKNKK